METRPRRGLFPFFEGGGVVQPADDRLSCCWSRRSGRACACVAHCIPLHVEEEDDSPVIGCGLGWFETGDFGHEQAAFFRGFRGSLLALGMLCPKTTRVCYFQLSGSCSALDERCLELRARSSRCCLCLVKMTGCAPEPSRCHE